MKIFNTIVTILVCVCAVRADYCPSSVSSKIQECVQPVAEYAKVLNNNQDPKRQPKTEFSGAFSLPNMGGRVFNELCKLIHRFNQCVQEPRRECPRHVTISLIDSSYGYLCNEGYNTFLESAECLMELDRQPAVKKCHDETLSEIERANGESGIAMAAKLDRMCGALNFFSGCVRSPIKKECGISAWQVIYRVLKDTTNTLMPGCQFTGGHNRHRHGSTSTTTEEIPTTEEEREIYTTRTPSTHFSMMSPTSFISESMTVPPRKTMRKNPTEAQVGLLNESTRLTSLTSSFLAILFILFV